MLVHQYRCTFVHIPKTAGKSVQRFFGTHWQDHKDIPAKRVLDMGDKPTIHVVIIYQNRRLFAKNFYETIVSPFDGACDFRLDLWNVRILAMPQINITAAKAAGQADLVILSVCRKCQLPPEAREWWETWPV